MQFFPLLINLFALANVVYIKDIVSLNFGNYMRFSVEVSEKSQFDFTADEKMVRIIFKDKIGVVKKDIIRKINATLKTSKLIKNIEFTGNGISLQFYKNFALARYFVIPFPYKIVFDISFKEMEIEDIIEIENEDEAGEKKPVVIIDAGHGGNDPGTIFGRYKEKNITLSVAREIAELLKKDFRVLLTREEDRFISLEERSGLANAMRCDAFISIHVNSARSKNAKGFEIFYFSRSFSKYALYVASKENGIKLKEDDMVLFDIYSDMKENESRNLAVKIKRFLGELNNVRTVEGAPFYVLAGTFCPAVLIEIGFLTNPQDRKNFGSKTYLQSIARQIYRGITDFLSQNPQTFPQ